MTANAHFQIAIDGPASAGKSTIAKILAHNFQYVYVDTGSMYRTITLAAHRAGLAYSDEGAIAQLLPDLQITFQPGTPLQRVFLNGQEVTEAIRQPEITNNVSQVAAFPKVREFLLGKQREIAAQHSVVMDGRDIGTTVLPHAQVKIYLVASVAERAQRRYRENLEQGIDVDLATLTKDIEERDYKDMHRKLSPLTKAADAIEVDTTSKSIDQVVSEITNIILKKQQNHPVK
ncbi:(d)CMP kinase [Lactobacillaceae bacterium L1_55_11]|nr:(d)CMP kinase [Lactobacillaceae bacterium L1_55_11]